MKTVRRLLLLAVVVAVAGVATLAAMSGYYGGDDGSGCARCHEIRPMVNDWAWSVATVTVKQPSCESSMAKNSRIPVRLPSPAITAWPMSARN